jgi:hypothetical protein
MAQCSHNISKVLRKRFRSSFTFDHKGLIAIGKAYRRHASPLALAVVASGIRDLEPHLCDQLFINSNRRRPTNPTSGWLGTFSRWTPLKMPVTLRFPLSKPERSQKQNTSHRAIRALV